VTSGEHDVIARLRDGTEVAAWMFKAKPEVWDVIGAIRACLADPSAPPIDSWGLVDNYRVALVHAGQPCVLWVTGGRHSPTTGVWAMGHVTTEPYPAPEGDDGGLRPHVGLELDLLASPIRLIELATDERFARAEIIRAPRVSSPVALTGEEWEAIDDAWSDAFSPDGLAR